MPDAAIPTGDVPKNILEYIDNYKKALPGEQAKIKRSLNELFNRGKPLQVGTRSFPVAQVYTRITGEPFVIEPKALNIDPKALKEDYNLAKQANNNERMHEIKSSLKALVENYQGAVFQMPEGHLYSPSLVYSSILGERYNSTKDENLKTLTELKTSYDKSKETEKEIIAALGVQLSKFKGIGSEDVVGASTKEELKNEDTHDIKIMGSEEKKARKEVIDLRKKRSAQQKWRAEIQSKLIQAIGENPDAEFRPGGKNSNDPALTGAEAYKFVTGEDYKPEYSLSPVEKSSVDLKKQRDEGLVNTVEHSAGGQQPQAELPVSDPTAREQKSIKKSAPTPQSIAGRIVKAITGLFIFLLGPIIKQRASAAAQVVAPQPKVGLRPHLLSLALARLKAPSRQTTPRAKLSSHLDIGKGTGGAKESNMDLTQQKRQGS